MNEPNAPARDSDDDDRVGLHEHIEHSPTKRNRILDEDETVSCWVVVQNNALPSVLIAV